MKLSIIVPVYNLEKYISDTLYSLLAIQFSNDYEILVVNDGSTDASEEIIDQFQKDNDRIRLFSIENNGVSNARNVGISKALGKYITFVDGDDTVEPDFFEKAVRELDSGGYDFVQGNYKIIDGDNIRYEQFVSDDVVITDKDTILEKMFGFEKIIHNAVWGKVYRTENIKNILFDRTLKIAEDQKFVFDVINASSKIKLLSCVGYNYVQRSTSAMHKINISRDIDKLMVISYVRNNINNQKVISYLERHELYVLLSVYDMTTINGGNNNDYYKRINELKVNSIWFRLDNKTRIKVLLLKYAKSLHDVILRKRSKRVNG